MRVGDCVSVKKKIVHLSPGEGLKTMLYVSVFIGEAEGEEEDVSDVCGFPTNLVS